MNIGSKIPTKPKEYTEEELKLRKELLKFKGCYIFVNTNFRRKTEPIHVLAFCESQRNLAINKSSLVFKNDMEQFKIISDMVKKHYITSEGTIGIWGKIKNYVYHHNDNKSYIFDIDGNLLEGLEVQENKAILTNKKNFQSIK